MTTPNFAESQDLHDFLAAYTEAYPADVVTVHEPIDPVEEITAVVWRLAEEGRHPLLRFAAVGSFDVEVVTEAIDEVQP